MKQYSALKSLGIFLLISLVSNSQNLVHAAEDGGPHCTSGLIITGTCLKNTEGNWICAPVTVDPVCSQD